MPIIDKVYVSNDNLKNYLYSAINQAKLRKATVKLYQLDQAEDSSVNFHFGIVSNSLDYRHTSHPIIYQRQLIGVLYLPEKDDLCHSWDIENIAKRIAIQVNRYQVDKLSANYLGKELALTGNSDHVINIEGFIENAANSSGPVIIEGEFGSEKLSVASMIHYNSEIKHKPFIEVNCTAIDHENFIDRVTYYFDLAKGGSIFFQGIDELSQFQQNCLVELLATSTVSALVSVHSRNVRILTSSTESLYELVKNNKFSRVLYHYLNFLCVFIPSLRQRKEDIPHILKKLSKEYQRYPEQVLSKEVVNVLCNYHWPENYIEIERVVARLMTLTNSNSIDLSELYLLTPELEISHSDSKNNGCSKTAVRIDLIPCLMERDYEKISNLHVGLQNALIFMAENYSEEMNMSDLSNKSFVSPSHISYLFKFHLKRTFKQLLAELRVEKSKKILSERPNSRITDVYLEVGFGDLSHFEKTFKRHTKMTPRAYKNSFKLRNSIPK